MVQVKKADMRGAMLTAAFDLFSRKGYAATTLSEIARNAGTTGPNLYVYFESKLAVVYELYEPWLLLQVEALQKNVFALRGPRQQLHRLFIGLWSDIPLADRHFANVLIEALASTPPDTRKPRDLLHTLDAMVTAILMRIVPKERTHLVSDGVYARILWMAFDGFSINQRIGQKFAIERTAELMTMMLLGE
ncbi:TetR/AcrR family transcriptional regulator [Paraburkholderia sp. J10-1]|uniref:TetR/AcrR family transcriptional regulator n=1 Tax=Paraburkholderia sp. J10-1 TaxID=2805430 RepID=UPI002AB7613D|nr:TetR/AcrR family transcriptional regulator [Paraburkholderia sp. J10-1]